MPYPEIGLPKAFRRVLKKQAKVAQHALGVVAHGVVAVAAKHAGVELAEIAAFQYLFKQCLATTLVGRAYQKAPLEAKFFVKYPHQGAGYSVQAQMAQLFLAGARR